MRTGFKIKSGSSSRIWGGGKESNISEGRKASKQIDAKVNQKKKKSVYLTTKLYIRINESHHTLHTPSQSFRESIEE